MSKRSDTRRRGGCAAPFLLFVLLLVAVGLFLYWDNNTIDVHEETVVSAALPSEFDGLRIAHLSDLHGKEFGTDNAVLISRVAAAQPDLIVITGDLIDQESQYAALPDLMDALTAIAPTYYVTGNHEWAVRKVKELKELLTEHGVRVLSDEYELWTRGDATLAVAGIDDPNGPADQKTGTELRAEIDADYTILLAHRDPVETYAAWGYDLVLCGHGHGGIIRIPILDKRLLSSNRTLFPKYDGGVYTFDNGFVCCVSRGLGSNTVPIHAFRLFNRPDLPILVLRSAAK